MEAVFEEYNVTRYKGRELFGLTDFEIDTPVSGLSISSVQSQSYGVEFFSSLDELVQLPEMESAKREKPLSNKEIQKIYSRLKKDPGLDCLDLEYHQACHDRNQVVSVINKFA